MPHEAHDSSRPTVKTKVYVVDDTRTIRDFALNLLQEAGYEVEGAPDGAKGLALIFANEPDVVLLDMEMPVMNGFNVLEVLARRQHLFSVIMFTNHSESEHIVQALSRGADDYIVKPFKENELLAKVAAAERSVSLKRKLADALRRADEALSRLQETQAQLVEEKKLRVISRLAAGVAHEINNPLAFIQSNISTLRRYTEFLLSGLDTCLKTMETNSHNGKSPSPAAGIAGEINLKKLTTIRNDILPLIQETQDGFDRISNIVKGFRQLEYGISDNREVRPEDLNSIIEELLNAAPDQVPNGVTLTRQLLPHPLPVMATLVMLNSAFGNILRNAVEAVGETGQICFSTGREGNMFFCDIRDTGPGIKEQVKPSIFDPFFTTKLDGQHLGLGLTIAECFVNAHGGTIQIESDPDCGTRFRVLLPAAG